MKHIELTQGLVALVNNTDFKRVSKFKWFAYRGRRTFYAARQVSLGNNKQKMVKMHRFLMGAEEHDEVDHKDHCGLNNLRSNLRLCPAGKNTMHYQKPVTNTSGYVGVSWHPKARKWRAEFSKDGKNIYLGLFKDPQEAARARDLKVKEHRGEFSFLNF